MATRPAGEPAVSTVFTCVTRLGVHSITVTGIDAPSSVNTRVMPALRPTIPMAMSVHLDLHFDAGRPVELRERVHGLLGRVDDLHQPLVRADLVLVARILVGVRRDKDREALLAGGQRDRPAHDSTGALGGLDDFPRRLVDQAMIESLEPDADGLVSRGHLLNSVVSPKERLGDWVKPGLTPGSS